MLGLCHYGPTLLRFWFQTDLGRENSATFLKIKAGKTFSYHGHAVRQFLCSDWSKFDRWVHAENLCSILKVVYFGGVYMTPGRLSPGASSLRFPLMGLYLFTWYHHKMSRGQESPRREFTPVLVPGREFHSGTKSPNSIMWTQNDHPFGCEMGLPVDWNG